MGVSGVKTYQALQRTIQKPFVYFWKAEVGQKKATILLVLCDMLAHNICAKQISSAAVACFVSEQFCSLVTKSRHVYRQVCKSVNGLASS